MTRSVVRSSHRASRRLLCLVGLVGAFGLTAVAAVGAVGGVSWGSAIEVPGSASLNVGVGGLGGASAGVNSVSCASAGNCAAGGSYLDGSGTVQAFVVDETHGVWGSAIEVPGSAAFDLSGASQSAGVECPSGFSCQGVNSVSCASPGNCAAGGEYTDDSRNDQAFVVDEKNGVWGDAIEVPGTAALNVGGGASVLSVSCASAGNCGAAGSFIDASGRHQPFVVDEKNGVWGSAVEVPGSAALNTERAGDVGASANSISCRGPGNCTLGGYYENTTTGVQPFVADEKNGVWGSAREVRGNAVFNSNFSGRVNSVACASVGDCVAGGFYTPRHFAPNHGRQTAFVVVEKHGVWGRPIDVPRIWNHGWYAATVLAVSCGSVGNCAAGGTYEDVDFGLHAFVVAEKKGVWGAAIRVPGTVGGNGSGAPPTYARSEVTSISCAAAGSCAVGGYNSYSRGDTSGEDAFLETERPNGSWGSATKVPGTGNFGGRAWVTSVSCVRTGSCVAAGFYDDTSAGNQAFVTSP